MEKNSYNAPAIRWFTGLRQLEKTTQDDGGVESMNLAPPTEG